MCFRQRDPRQATNSAARPRECPGWAKSGSKSVRGSSIVAYAMTSDADNTKNYRCKLSRANGSRSGPEKSWELVRFQ